MGYTSSNEDATKQFTKKSALNETLLTVQTGAHGRHMNFTLSSPSGMEQQLDATEQMSYHLDVRTWPTVHVKRKFVRRNWLGWLVSQDVDFMLVFDEVMSFLDVDSDGIFTHGVDSQAAIRKHLGPHL